MDLRRLARATWGLLMFGQGCAASVPAKRSEALAQTRAAVRELVTDNDLPGVAYAQVGAGALQVEEHAGLADAVDESRVSASTMFMVYSVTKALTAIAVLQLVEAGRMGLDAPLSRYVPDHPYGEGVTIRRLLAHTAGVPSPIPTDWFFVEGDRVDHEAALARVLRDNPSLKFDPGTEYGYSNVGYWLLEKAIEAASEQPFETYLRERVFAPVGVAEDAVSFDLPPRTRLATGHLRKISLLNLVLSIAAPSRYWLDSRNGWTRLARARTWGHGYGGATATVGALAAVLADLLREDGVLLKQTSKAALFARQEAPAGKPIGGALGWVLGELDGVAYVGKQGGGLGFQGNVRLYPAIGLGTVYLANATAITPGPVDTVSDTLDGPMVRFLAREQHAPASPSP